MSSQATQALLMPRGGDEQNTSRNKYFCYVRYRRFPRVASAYFSICRTAGGCDLFAPSALTSYIVAT